jgi:hypothetical protein
MTEAQDRLKHLLAELEAVLDGKQKENPSVPRMMGNEIEREDSRTAWPVPLQRH